MTYPRDIKDKDSQHVCSVNWTAKMKILIYFLPLAIFTSAIDHRISPSHPVSAQWNRGTKIVGGEEVDPHSIPYQVGLYMDGAFCGGSLISTRWVLTAAHCAEVSKTPQVILGAHRMRTSEPTQIIITGKRAIIHEGWDSDTLKNDIALIELARNAPINDFISTVKLADSGSPSYAGKIATASGWGLASDAETHITNVLRKVSSKVLTNDECQTLYGESIHVWDEIICMDGVDGKSTCNGDSGGPLIVDGVLVGLTSFGVSLGCEKGYPAAFTRISSYRTWIENNTGVELPRI